MMGTRLPNYAVERTGLALLAPAADRDVGPTSDKGLAGANGGSMGAQGRPHAYLLVP